MKVSFHKLLLTGAMFALVSTGAFAQETSGTKEADDKASAPVAAASGDMKTLELELPKPVFVGTPKNIKVENLEAPGTKPEKIQVPKDVKNLAAGKEVTASDEEPIIGELEQITDGDKEASDGSYVEFGPGTQWVQIDLGQESELFAIALWHYHQTAVVYNDVVVQVADDKDFITNVHTIFNNDHDNSSNLGVGKDKAYIETNEGKLINAKGVKGRYVRLYSKGNTANQANHYIEVEVYGRPAK